MEWVLKHLQLLIVIGGAIAWWLNQRRAAQAGGEESRPEKTFDDPELAERTRKIREEIQRKIEQRARGYTQPQPAAAQPEPPELPPILREIVARLPESPVRSRATVSHVEAQRQAEILERQAALAEQLRQAQEMKAAAARRVAFEEANADKESAVLGETRTTVLGDLRSPDALRRAFILREVIGPPVALR